ncbi:hypothetical protein [Janthinobacterium lividum]|uniref:hypothetical protein n=1 Tax=Janthinobacterium lividum TaxID=29581 RepID=UPI0020926363|nr:hypothetical protein [Janthinobacterium lividum]
MSDADQGDTKSKNWLLQGTYKTTDKLKLGLSYGISKNDDNTAGTGLKSNANLTLARTTRSTARSPGGSWARRARKALPVAKRR